MKMLKFYFYKTYVSEDDLINPISESSYIEFQGYEPSKMSLPYSTYLEKVEENNKRVRETIGEEVINLGKIAIDTEEDNIELFKTIEEMSGFLYWHPKNL